VIDDARAALQVLASSLAAASDAVAELAVAWPAESASSAAAHDLSVRELAQRLGRSANAITDWLRAGLFKGAYRLPGAKRPGAWRIPESGIVAFTERQRPKASRHNAAGGTIRLPPGPRPHPSRARDGAAPDLSAWRKVRKMREAQ